MRVLLCVLFFYSIKSPQLIQLTSQLIITVHFKETLVIKSYKFLKIINAGKYCIL